MKLGKQQIEKNALKAEIEINRQGTSSSEAH
jgi:hypothetical protein